MHPCIPDPDQCSLAQPSTFTAKKVQCFKTKKCRFWLEGRCKRGENCTYAHNEEELRLPPDLAKTKICLRWKRGVCSLPDHRCPYAHGTPDLRNPYGSPIIQHEANSVKLRKSPSLRSLTIQDKLIPFSRRSTSVGSCSDDDLDDDTIDPQFSDDESSPPSVTYRDRYPNNAPSLPSYPNDSHEPTDLLGHTVAVMYTAIEMTLSGIFSLQDILACSPCNYSD